MPKKPTADDAKIIMRLYDLRREAEMRKARAWFAGWWPRGADDVVQMMNAGTTPQENAWFRQVSGYWDMAASFVLRGALNEELFFDSGGECGSFSRKFIPTSKRSARKGSRLTTSSV